MPKIKKHTKSSNVLKFSFTETLNHNECTVTSAGGANTLNARGLHAHRCEKRLEQSAAFGDIKRTLVNEVVDIK